jgi:prepilin-type N-terminal cleavage/methylation domain-containing protein
VVRTHHDQRLQLGDRASRYIAAAQRRGFTLIELLMVVVIIGLLASLAIPRFSDTKDRARLASMKSDLRNLVSAQETYMMDYQTYASDPNALAFQRSPNVTITLASSTGFIASWSASAEANGGSLRCKIGLGADSTHSGGGDGQIVCQ